LFAVGIYSVGGPRLVGSLNRPSGNLASVSFPGSVLAAKRIELLHDGGLKNLPAGSVAEATDWFKQFRERKSP
jgi:hypothetical protein